MLSHLIYVSQRKASCTETEIQKILDACIRNNGKADITGVLLYSETQFIQYLEGNYTKIIHLYDQIKGDTRHKSPVMVSSSPIKTRTFPSWQMGARKLGGDIEYKTTLGPGERKVFVEILSGIKQHDQKALALLKKFFN